MDQPLRVLQIVSGLEQGGIEKVIENYYLNINREEVQFDFISHRPVGLVENNIKNLGCKIYHISFRRKHPFKSAIQTYKIIKKNHYRVIHIHGNLEIIPELLMAKLAGAKVRIAHSHMSFDNPSKIKVFSNQFARLIIQHLASHLFACSDEAGRWSYSKKIRKTSKFKIMYNAIDLEKFCYDEQKRNKLRQIYSIDGNLVIGNIGRLCYQKNHEFLIDIFECIVKKNNKARLIIIGDGELRDNVLKQINEKGIKNYVKIYESRNDIEDMMQAFDVFVMPSRFEGLGIVAIEAQAAGLSCFISDTVTKEVKISDSVYFNSLMDSPIVWANNILKHNNHDRSTNKINCDNYNIVIQAKIIQQFYVNVFKEI